MKDIKICWDIVAILRSVEDAGDENCTMEELVSFETSPI